MSLIERKLTDYKNTFPKWDNRVTSGRFSGDSVCGCSETDKNHDEEKAVVRLKRYIALCGVRRNYKKLLDGCRSTRSKVAVLKKELEDLGVRGRPKRRGTSAMQVRLDPPSSYQRTLNSDSDSDQENDAHKGRRKMSEWANLHGIISDDADTD
ncbi:hypothetical protein GOODEAATRI_010653 [Goodea atripinnis]|uniref:Uncharacterized protein n=1 Tax=Goodea atripinnis TaxID=208336 RepID=A0ABV0MSZ7_9TELE